MSKPLVSVIIPTRNRPLYLKTALESLKNQTFKDFEAVVVNDGGEEVAKILEEFRDYFPIKYKVLERNCGVSRARNEGLRVAAGEYLSYLDDDDLFYPQHLEICLKTLETAPEKLVYTRADYEVCIEINQKQVVFHKLKDYGKPFSRERLLLANFIPTPNIVHHRSLLELAGEFDESLPVHEDWDLWIRFSLHTNFRFIPETTTCIRLKQDRDYSPARRALFLETFKKIYARYSFLLTEQLLAERANLKENFELELLLSLLAPDLYPLLRAFLHRYESYIEILERERARIPKNLEALSARVKELEGFLEEKEEEWRKIRAEKQELETLLEGCSAELEEVRRELHRVTHSFGYRLIIPLYKALNRVFPERTRRRVLLKLALHALFDFRKTRSHLSKDRAHKFFHLLRRGGLEEAERKLDLLLKERSWESPSPVFRRSFWEKACSRQNKDFLVSVIVPNYNHAPFLEKRLQSIYNQSYPNLEVILLDDASTDGSQEILYEYARRFPERTKIAVNSVNSGSPFSQWRKGLSLASGDLIWIAESDDWVSENFLETLTPFFNHPTVMLAFCQTLFVKKENESPVWSLAAYLSDIMDPSHWERPFLESAAALVRKWWSQKNLIPNVSGALFRKPGPLPLLEDTDWLKMKVCGDWLFYLEIAKGGVVAYSPQATNYYRIHEDNTSVGTHAQDLYYEEHERVARYLMENYKIPLQDLKKQEKILKKHWLLNRPRESLAGFERCYNLQRIAPGVRPRPHLLMVTYALTAGGGEVFPVRLANLLREKGYAVTLLNLNREPAQKEAAQLLRSDLPLVEWAGEEWGLILSLLEELDVDIVHTHHAWCDYLFCELLQDHPRYGLVATMHGMYEMMPEGQFQRQIPLLKRVDRFVYLSEKNLTPFRKFGLWEEGRFIKVFNAIDESPLHPVSRESLGLPSEAFLITLASRAIPEKGWSEAIEAVRRARELSGREIHLLLLGVGPEYDRLQKESLESWVHLLGYKPNVCDYFAASDLALLPSRFKGETFPLVVIEALYAGCPVAATSLGEVKNMLSTPEGLAGEVVELEGGRIPIKALAEVVARLATEREYYEEKKRLARKAYAKFNKEALVRRYIEIYEELYRDKRSLSF